MTSFGGIGKRERVSSVREWDWTVATISAGQSFSDEIDVRFATSVAVSMDNGMTGTYVALYASHELGGAYRPVRDSANEPLVFLRADCIKVIPSEIVFPLGYIRFASCSDVNGTSLVVEVAARRLVVMLKA